MHESPPPECPWYVRKLVVDTEESWNPLLISFVRPLLAELDQRSSPFTFHVFRYSGDRPGGRPYLRFRVQGELDVRAHAENFVKSHLPPGVDALEDDPYDVNSELDNEPNRYRDAEDVRKAWRLYELASRIAVESAELGFSGDRLKDNGFTLGIRLSHLFLNSMGYGLPYEFMVHRLAMVERSVTALKSRYDLPSASVVYDRFGPTIGEVEKCLNKATDVLNKALSG